MTVQEMMRVLVELPHDMEITVAVAEFEDRLLLVDSVDADRYNRRLVVVLEPEINGYYL